MFLLAGPDGFAIGSILSKLVFLMTVRVMKIARAKSMIRRRECTFVPESHASRRLRFAENLKRERMGWALIMRAIKCRKGI